jgi:upstream activation factor subunit UAF30
MPRNSKSTKPAAEPVVVAPVVPSVPVVKEKKTKTPKTVTESAASVVPVVETNAVSLNLSSVENVVLDTEDSQLIDQSNEFVAKLHNLATMISTIKTEYRGLEKKWVRLLKVAQKQNSKRKRKAGTRQPSGFVKPTKISEELSKFLDKPVGCEMARTEVTREINQYIRKHDLQDKSNGRKIIPDTKLAALLKLTSADELTYFNLQKFMSPHFTKNVKEVVAV